MSLGAESPIVKGYDGYMLRMRLSRRATRMGLYTLLSLVFWATALWPGGGGTSEVGVEWPGALLNGLLLIPLWKGRRWSAALLTLEGLVSATVIGSGGIPPWGPAFGVLSCVALGQMWLAHSLWWEPDQGRHLA